MRLYLGSESVYVSEGEELKYLVTRGQTIKVITAVHWVFYFPLFRTHGSHYTSWPTWSCFDEWNINWILSFQVGNSYLVHNLLCPLFFSLIITSNTLYSKCSIVLSKSSTEGRLSLPTMDTWHEREINHFFKPPRFKAIYDDNDDDD